MVLLCDDVELVLVEDVEEDASSAGVPADDSCHAVILDDIEEDANFVVVHQHDPVALVAHNRVLLDADNGRAAEDTIIVLADFILGDEETLSVNNENTVSSCL